ncbi:AbrB/MazE/SpoVT family DNA-binding domain-containing protein [Caulobacter flavus]|jgi:antitoxin VapB|uniref:AbrB/MazE/SpoVT family DNA-binding domain-containing protein n=1 Tax=Caulobacter flavus TaxID=1679497 RepID=A0A2N5CN01_9CAUL|nr:AbrB/MazE/SpoVT family DNA-binding domain-containing protein [Caulobacter flavus]AYV46584.1 AbrB/MazE/SpoVT family DNA-binding domain-containing protein [Caulobacter flavus]PLR07820.1 AbrB/MazE/SpoVT family DNA-binding domain-containing protein [Caulobacter flavus]
MTRSSTRTFRSGNSQAVRLPKEVAFAEETELTLVRAGDVLTIYPSRGTVQDLVARLADLPKPSAVEVRDDEDLPERPGL